MKDKTVKFILSPEMLLSEMMDYGYPRNEIIQLFEELENEGYGVFIRGTRGRGNPSKFICNNSAPNNYTITFQVKKLYNNYAGLPATEKEKPTQQTVAIATCSYKYALTVEDGLLLLHRIPTGHDTIENALKRIWAAIQDNVEEKETVHMNSFDIVASRLRGLGHYQLK